MAIDPQFGAFLALLQGMPPLADLTPAQLRRVEGIMGAPTVAVAQTRDLVIPTDVATLPARLYRSSAGGVLPLVLYFHGGGFVVGDLASHDGICRELCAGAACAVLAVAYRLAPEHKFPAAPADCLAALAWARGNAQGLGIDVTRIAVAGDSAGGNLAAVTAIQARDLPGPALAGQVLLYPVTDHYSRPTASVLAHAQGPLLTLEFMRFFADHYLSDAADADDPMAAPLQTNDLAGLPPALVITAEFDPLCDEGEAYAARLRAAAVPTVAVRYGGAIHGFMGIEGVALKDAAMVQTCGWLQGRFR